MQEVLNALQEFEDNAYRPSLKPTVSAAAMAQAMIALREKIERSIKAAPPAWVVCFRCYNRKKTQDQNGRQVRTCHKCTRNSFAPCGTDKEDWFNREVSE